MRKVASIGIVLEDCATIVFEATELSTFAVSSDARDVGIDEDGFMYDFGILSDAQIGIKPNGNHTYNNFGTPSKDTTFERLIKDQTKITQIQLRCNDGLKYTYLADDELMRVVGLDEHGGLTISMSLMDEDELDQWVDDCGDDW